MLSTRKLGVGGGQEGAGWVGEEGGGRAARPAQPASVASTAVVGVREGSVPIAGTAPSPI